MFQVLFLLFVFINVYWLPTRFPYHMSFYSNTTDNTSGEEIVYPYWSTCIHTRFFVGFVHVPQSLWKESLNSDGQQIHRYQQTNNHRKSLYFKKKTYDVGNPGSGLGQAQISWGAKPVNGIPIPPLDNSIPKGNIYIILAWKTYIKVSFKVATP